jgi:hypothetical protein
MTAPARRLAQDHTRRAGARAARGNPPLRGQRRATVIEMSSDCHNAQCFCSVYRLLRDIPAFRIAGAGTGKPGTCPRRGTSRGSLSSNCHETVTMTNAHFITDGGGGDNSPCPRPRGAAAQRRGENLLRIRCESERRVRIWKPALRRKRSFALGGRGLVSSQDNGRKP